MVPTGFEPVAYPLSRDCSTAELRDRISNPSERSTIELSLTEAILQESNLNLSGADKGYRALLLLLFRQTLIHLSYIGIS